MSGAKNKPFEKLDIDREKWERIFGKPKPKQLGVFVVKDGELVPADDAPIVHETAIHGDKLYTKCFDYGAGRKFGSRTERREWMKSKGLIEAR